MSVGRQMVFYEEGVAPIYFHPRRMLHQHTHDLKQGFLKVRDIRKGGGFKDDPSAVSSSWRFATLTMKTIDLKILALNPVLGSERGKSVKLSMNPISFRCFLTLYMGTRQPIHISALVSAYTAQPLTHTYKTS